MAKAIPKVCSHPGCGKTSADVRCPKHTAQRAREQEQQRAQSDRRRGSRHVRGYGSKWERERDEYLELNPWCVDCETEGRKVPATQVDHDVPCKGTDPDFWKRSNWRGRCRMHHARKTAKFDGGFGNPVRRDDSRENIAPGRGVRISEDGRPPYRARPTYFTPSKLTDGGRGER